MKLSRRDWLKAGAAAGATVALGPGSLGAEGQSAAASAKHSTATGSKWGMGFDPGQTLPPEAANGPWTTLRAVKEKKVFDSHCHVYSIATQGHNYAEEDKLHATAQWHDYTAQLIPLMDHYGIAQAAANSSHVSYDTFVKDDVLPHLDRFIRSAGMPTDLSKGKEMTPQLIADIYRTQLERDHCALIGETAGDAFMQLVRSSKYAVKDLKPMADVVIEHDVPVQMHTGWSATVYHSYQAAWRWAEIMGSLLAEYPQVKFILCHTGGEITIPDGYEAVRLAYSFDNAYVDTSKSPPEIVSEVVRGIGAERVMFGSDWNRPELLSYGPFNTRAVNQHWYNLNTIATADLNEDQRDWILYKSARKLLKLPPA